MRDDRRKVLLGLGAVPLLPLWAKAAEESTTEDAAAGETTAEESSMEAPEATETASEPSFFTGDVVLGSEDAKLTVIEYASVTCPHCATFHKTTWPEVKKNYVDTGKIRFILREVYFDQYGLWASMTARCGGEAGFYPMMDTFLNTQSVWTRAEDIGAEIQKIGRRAGLSTEQLGACLSDREYAKTLLANYQENAGKDAVRSTPTFIIGDEQHTGAIGYEQFSALLDAALAES